ncbi:MAG: excinuclease ABC subunit UvrC [Nitrospirae bacterium]|nr:MAG: excinuclease ABC subunit UvrC [Nitrospirota bacterium]
MKKTALEEKLKHIPDSPGVYLFKDEKERVLYVGKAKSLKNRVRSYFRSSSSLEPRKQKMVRKVRDLSVLVTENELEALALEANLIKEYRPKYNVILRDDKNYPYIRLSINEEWPRLEIVRRIAKDGALYFGPYIPAGAIRETLSYIRRSFGIRPCRYKLDKPMRPCIQYQMKRCPAPCAGLIGRDEYMKAVRDVELFLRGKKDELISDLEKTMRVLSDRMEYEEAAKVRDRLKALRIAFDSQRVIAPELGDMDVFGTYSEGGETAVQVLFVRNGLLTGEKVFYLKDTAGLSLTDLLGMVIKSFYSGDVAVPPQVILEGDPEDREVITEWLSERRGKRVRLIVPKRGKKRELLDMAVSNARNSFGERRKVGADELVSELMSLLQLKEMPSSIGAFDISTTFGRHSVGAFIWWEEGEFRKENYRHVHIRETPGIDDYAMMEETVRRVTKNLTGNLPDIVIIDGGEGQLKRAYEGMRSVIAEGDIPVVVGLAKKPDRLIFPDGREVLLRGGGRAAMLLIKIRDEVHRFGISFHRKVRGKGMLESRLESVKGIGKKRRLALLRHFRSVRDIEKAGVEEIARVEGMNRKLAEELLEALKERS